MGWFTFGRAKANERRIFAYFDGERQRKADPVEVLRKLAMHPTFDLEGHLKDMASDIKDVQCEAVQQTVSAVRDVFGVKAWAEDSDGLTEGETLALLGQFLAYNDVLKKNGSGPQTLPGAMGSVLPESTATKPSMASG